MRTVRVVFTNGSSAMHCGVLSYRKGTAYLVLKKASSEVTIRLSNVNEYTVTGES